MRAVQMNGTGGPEVLTWGEAPDVTPASGEVLIEVAAAGVNRADLLQRQGNYPPPPGASATLGLECSGVIAELGANTTGWQVGDRVCALLSGGGYAERVAVPAGQLLPVPEGLDLAAAAGLPEVAATVYSNLVTTAGLRAGQLLLVHGGGSGIGTHAIQLAKQLGARIAVTAGSAGKLARCTELGADIAIDYKNQDFVEVLREHGGADVILDNMGAAYLPRNIEALAPHGHLVVIGMQGGVRAELNLGALLRKWGTIHATNLRGRPATGPNSKAEVIAGVRERVWPLVAAGAIVPVIHAEVADPAEAHRLLDGAETVGKVLLTLR
ncbi:NAD(P)H-quinone oxidoreductase [Nocardia sp. NPDC057353]|uniref:NAD(P)H-quinone oxidoreductase n=1 Tax=Nocardia sp. NPDC057353 TaxID=3346104 RepID=UPI003644368F